MSGTKTAKPTRTENGGMLGRIWLLVVLVAATVLLSMAYIYYTGRRMAAVHGPLIDAAMEIKVEAAIGHLWLEEAISGDQNIAIGKIIEHLDRADWYAKAMLEGGTSAEGRFSPLFDKKMRTDIAQVRKSLAEFKELALERWKNRHSTGIASPTDTKFDSIFDELLHRADVVETDLQRLTARNLKHFARVQLGLIAGCVLLTAVVGINFAGLMRRQITDARRLQSANRRLDAANQQLMAGEQQLKAANQQLNAYNQQLASSEQQLKAANQQLQAAYQQLKASREEISALARFPSENPNLVMRVTKEGRIIYANKPAEELLDYEGCTIGDYLPEKLSRVAKDVFKEGRHKEINLDSEYASQLLTFAPVADLGYLNVYGTDVTARKIAEDELKFTQFAVDNAADAAFWMGEDAGFIYVNDAACRSLGYSREELLKMTVHDIDPDFPRHVWPDHWKELKEKGSFTIESRHRTRNGRLFPVEIAVNFVRFKHREYNCAFARDITDRKEAQEQLRQTRANLEHTARLVTAGEMAAGLAHELNQPLCAILNYANAARRRVDTEGIDRQSITEILARIAAQANRAGEIIRRLRSLIRKREPKQQSVNINEIVEEVIKLEQAESREYGIALRTELAQEIQNVTADDIQVEQVILNLVRNGFEAMAETPPENRSLTIRTAALDADKIEVAVSDSGKGIPREAANRIFDSFFSTRTEGLGVGLSLSRSIIESHGGKIWAESNENAGATVRFTLPVKGKRNG